MPPQDLDYSFQGAARHTPCCAFGASDGGQSVGMRVGLAKVRGANAASCLDVPDALEADSETSSVAHEQWTDHDLWLDDNLEEVRSLPDLESYWVGNFGF